MFSTIDKYSTIGIIVVVWKLETGDLAREKYEDEVECLLSLWAWAGFFKKTPLYPMR